MSMEHIIIPIIQEKNNKGIDDVLDTLKDFFPFKLTECYVLETDNPGMAALARELAARSGIVAFDLAAGSKGNGKKKVKTAESPRTCAVCGKEYTDLRYANVCSWDCRKVLSLRKKAAEGAE